MRTTLLSSIPAVMLATLLLTAPKRPDPLPQDLRSETLLVLLFDELAISGKRAKKHNELVVELNKKTMEELERYPYPSTVISRSSYAKNEDVPPHTYVLDGGVMQGFNKGETLSTSNYVYVSDVLIIDTRTARPYVVFKEKSRTYHMFLKYALREIPKRVEKGK